jgi:putative ABC transport system substrate-binding protein
VFAGASDPVGSGLVKSLARPGGNITGLSALGPDVATKRLELLRELLGDLRQVGVLGHRSAAQQRSEIGDRLNGRINLESQLLGNLGGAALNPKCPQPG